jgi:hypothetical protein
VSRATRTPARDDAALFSVIFTEKGDTLFRVSPFLLVLIERSLFLYFGLSFFLAAQEWDVAASNS